MYGQVLSATAPLAAAGVVSTLPSTGNDVWMTVATSLAAGLITWAVLYKVRRAYSK